MPRYELRNTSNNALSYVEGTPPFSLTGLVAPGTYRARVMSDEEPTDIVLAAVDPSFTNLTFDSPGGGDPNELTLTYTYAGDDDLVAYGVTSTEATPPGADAAARRANIIAGTGTGNLEEFSVDPFTGSTLELIAGALTASSESATHAHIFIQEKNNGGFSEIRTVALSNLDFTPATLSGAETTDANTIALTFTEAVFGTVAAGQFAFDIDSVAATVTNAVRSGSTVTLTVSDTIEVGGVLDALAYTPGALVDVRGNPVAAFSGETITNNESAWVPTDLGSKLVLWLDPSDLTKQFQDIAKTTAVTATGQSVFAVEKTAGTATVDALAAGGGSPGAPEITISGSDHYWTFSDPPGDTFRFVGLPQTTTDEVYANLRTSDSLGAFIAANGPNNAAGIIQDTAATDPHAGAGTPSYRVNGSPISSPTRDDLHTNWSTGTWNTIGITNLDTATAAAWNTTHLMFYTDGDLDIAGDLGDVLITQALTTDERASLEAWLAARKPA